MIKIRLFIFLLSISVMAACVNDDSRIRAFKAQGLLGSDERLNDMILLNDNEGYLFGERTGDPIWRANGEASRTSTAVIYRTHNGGKNWNCSFLGKGKVVKGYIDGNRIFALKVNSQDEQNDTSFIYCLNAASSKWDLYARIKGYVRDLIFFKGDYGLVNIHDSIGEFNLYETKNGGGKWAAIKLPHKIYQPLFKDNKVLYMNNDGVEGTSAYYNLFIEYDIVRKRSTIEKLPTGFLAYFMNEDQDQLFFAGVANGGILLYKRTGKNQYKPIYKLKLGARVFPQQLHVFGREILLLVGERESSYIKNHLFRSFDAGETWTEDDLADDLYASPVGFYNDTTKQLFNTWIYSGSGRIQVIDGK